jgi:hypothetical protein
MDKRIVDVKKGDLLWVGDSAFGEYMEVTSVRWLGSCIKVGTKSLSANRCPSKLAGFQYYNYPETVGVWNAN